MCVLVLQPVSSFRQIVAQGNGRFILVPIRPFCVLTKRIYEVCISLSSSLHFFIQLRVLDLSKWQLSFLILRDLPEVP